MLQPTNRLTLIDAMRPPAGFELESAMAVTFTLDLRALLTAPAAFALAGTQGVTFDGSHHEPIELLHAVRAHAGKLTVFSQAGEIALPPSRRVFAFLEQAVIPVRAPRGGVVHPKVWVLRYERTPDSDGEGERRLRVLVASRNLTFDTSWDTVIRLDESAGNTGADLSALADLFSDLLDQAQQSITPDHRRRVESLRAALVLARFTLPPGVDDLHVHILGLSSTSSPLPLEADRSLVISPFVSDDFFTSVRPARVVDELVSRPESLDLLSADALGAVVSAYAFDDGSVTDLGDGTERLSPHDPGRPLVGLHAKAFIFEEGARSRVFLGSANATGAAFESNVEILVELQGSVTNLGIDRLCDGTADELGLRSLFTSYVRTEAVGDEGEEDATLDGARRAIARLPIRGLVEESGSGWAVTYRSSEPVPVVGPSAMCCWPLASPGNRRQIIGGEPLEVRFETTIESISGFLAFEVVAESGRLTQFVVPVPLYGVPEDRDLLLLRALVGNAERFLRYLLALLDEDSARTDLLEAVDEVASTDRDDAVGPQGLPVLEKLLRTLRRNPAKLVGLDPLVSDLASDEILPTEFVELWETIREVVVVGEGSV